MCVCVCVCACVAALFVSEGWVPIASAYHAWPALFECVAIFCVVGFSVGFCVARCPPSCRQSFVFRLQAPDVWPRPWSFRRRSFSGARWLGWGAPVRSSAGRLRMAVWVSNPSELRQEECGTSQRESAYWPRPMATPKGPPSQRGCDVHFGSRTWCSPVLTDGALVQRCSSFAGLWRPKPWIPYTLPLTAARGR